MISGLPRLEITIFVPALLVGKFSKIVEPVEWLRVGVELTRQYRIPVVIDAFEKIARAIDVTEGRFSQ